MTDVVVFGKLVRARRIKLGFTQEALAAAAFGNLDRKGYISSVENGKKPGITTATVRKICDVLEIAVADLPVALRWEDATLDPDRAPVSEPMPLERTPQVSDTLRFVRQIMGIAVIVGLVIFSAEFISGLANIAVSIWPNGVFAPLVFFGWSSVFCGLLFYIFGLEGRGAYARAAWLEQGAWQDRYLKTVTGVLDRLDQLFVRDVDLPRLRPTAFQRNWSVGLYEKAWALAIVYPSAFLLLQWTLTGSAQELGFLQIWPQEPSVMRRFMICFCFFAAVPLVHLARRAQHRRHSIAFCGAAIFFNYAAMTYIWVTYWNVLVGPGALNLIGIIFILGAGLNLFKSVTHAAASAAVAGASVSLLFEPFLRLAEWATGRAGAGYNDPLVNTAHAAINHSLMLVLFVFAFRVLLPMFRGKWPWSDASLHLYLSAMAGVLMLLASTQEFWFPYYLLIGIFPMLNAVFDYLSIGLTRYALRLGADNFGWRTLAFSIVDLILALMLFLVLILFGSLIAQSLNTLLGGAFIPIKFEVQECLQMANSTLSAETMSAVKGIASFDTTCSNSVFEEVLSAPQEYLWLIAAFGSTLIPTLVHLAFALFAFGPAVLSIGVRRQITAWARGAAQDPFLRGGAALFFGVWLAAVLTLGVWVVQITGRVLTGELPVLQWVLTAING